MVRAGRIPPDPTHLFLSAACVSAEAATDLAAFDELGLLNIFAAFDATELDVFSFRAMLASLLQNAEATSTPRPDSPYGHLATGEVI